jgi:peptide/nickel transport system substrate-binding protein
MKRSSPLLIGLMALALAVSACRKNDPASEPGLSGDNILRFDVAAPFLSLNPAEVDVSGSTLIFPLLYSYLFVPDEHDRLQSDLAESWTYNEPTRTWTIHLRSDAFFHDGQPVTAEDVRYSIEAILENIQPALIASIERISSSSKHEISIHLNRPDPDFMRKIWTVEIIPRRETESGAEYHPIGSGPFVFSSREGEQKVILTANKNYYAGRPALGGVTFFYQPDQEKTWTRLLAGNTDIAREISPKNYEITRQYQDRFYFHHNTSEYYSILLYNTHDPLFTDERVRRALTRAIDRQYIVDQLLHGYGRVAAGPMGVDSPFHDSRLTPPAHDPRAALQEMAAAGWTLDSRGRFLEKEGSQFAFTLLIPEETQVEKAVARYIQLCFNDIGIQMDVRSRPYKEIVARYSGNNDFQAVLTEFPGAYRQSEMIIKGWLPDEQGKTLAGNFCHPEVTRLLDLALRAGDSQAEKEYLLQVEALLTALQPGSFLFQKTAFDVMSRRFSLSSPFSLSHSGIYQLRLAMITQE